MPAQLPELTERDFIDRLQCLLEEQLPPSVTLPREALPRLYQHYRELRRWNRLLSLVGPGTVDEVLSRHYVESLAALPLVLPDAESPGPQARSRPLTVVDIGSGGGFPGLVLAAALPGAKVTLVEARERKWTFLLSAARKAALPCRCVDARVGLPLPQGLPATIDVVTLRALKLNPAILRALTERLRPRGAILLWLGEETPETPDTLHPGRTVRLLGSRHRRILELTAEPGPLAEGPADGRREAKAVPKA